VIELDTNETKLLTYAAFRDICLLPSNLMLLDGLAASLTDAEPNFFTDNEGFGECAEAATKEEEQDRIRHLVAEMLSHCYATRLFVDAQNARYVDVMDHYWVPELEGENGPGDLLIPAVVDAIAASVNVVAKVEPVSEEDRRGCAEVISSARASLQARLADIFGRAEQEDEPSKQEEASAKP
jgi:hypothetical protein